MIFTSCSLIQVNSDRDMERTVIEVGDIKVDKATYASTYYNLVANILLYVRSYFGCAERP